MPVPWSMKKYLPICAPGWMSMPVVGQPVHGDGVQAGIGDDDLGLAGRRRVAVVERLEVRLHIGAYLRQLAQKRRGDVLGGALHVRHLPAAPQRDADLPVQVERHVLDQRRQVVLRVVDAVGVVPVIAREHQPQQLPNQVLDDLPVGLGEHLQPVDHPVVAVILQYIVRQRLHAALEPLVALFHANLSLGHVLTYFIISPSPSQQVPKNKIKHAAV